MKFRIWQTGLFKLSHLEMSHLQIHGMVRVGFDIAILLLELGALIGEGAGVRIGAQELGDTQWPWRRSISLTRAG